MEYYEASEEVLKMNLAAVTAASTRHCGLFHNMTAKVADLQEMLDAADAVIRPMLKICERCLGHISGA